MIILDWLDKDAIKTNQQNPKRVYWHQIFSLSDSSIVTRTYPILLSSKQTAPTCLHEDHRRTKNSHPRGFKILIK